MIALRPASARGHANFGWLDSHHTFSFGDYYDPANMGFSALRVINDDRVAPGRGFGAHPHRDMEILSYVLEGSLEHKDSMGSGSVLRRGQIQLMSAGTGVRHSEYNPSPTEPVHFLQIWILPNERGAAPRYQEAHLDALPIVNGFRLLASPDGAAGSLAMRQDARVYAARLEPGDTASLPLAPGRVGWVHVAEGQVKLGDITLEPGSGAGLEGEASASFRADSSAELLFFDLPPH